MKRKILFFIIAIILFAGFSKISNAAIGEYPCEDEARCKIVCKEGKFASYPSTFGATFNCIQDGYVSNTLTEGEKCKKQEECSPDLFCHDGVSDKCTKKYVSGDVCTSGAVMNESNCKNGCPDGKYYLPLAYSQMGATTFICGSEKPESKGAEILPGESSGPITDDFVPGTTTDESKIIQCGRPGQRMCHLCDLIKGFYNIIKYIQGIAIGVALLAMAIGGIIYIVSAGDPGLMDMAKSAIKNAAIGFVIVFASYLIINTSILYLGTKSDLGIKASWGTFNCDSRAADHL